MTKTDADRAGGTTTLSARLFAPGSRLTWLAALLLLAVGAVWVLLTPEGILGKADAVGYAVCHRIAARSFTLPGGRPVPLCARCSGTFLGVLVGLLGPVLLFGRRRAGGFPRLGLMVVMLGMTAWWGFDGANSFAHLIPREGIPRLYEPTNFLRLTTGMFNGITLGGLILPVLNATLWAGATDEPVLGRWWELLALYGTGAALIAMVYSEVPVLLYPLAVLSAVGVVAILAAVMTVFVTTLLRRENRARTLADAVPLVLLGLTAALVMIGGIDAVRYAMFGTWDGFVPPA
ncbi:MAG TPA: DUF2085 domain-containing protein [Aggregatilineales bacterium]|nr:DUF2085 domain-containing protein [Aggregatilineales bacterium]